MELQPITKEGRRLAELAEVLADELAPGVAEADHAGTFVVEHVTTLREHGWFGAPVPTELGGLGVESVHDLLVASSRLARGDAPTCIGANMHTAVVVGLVRQWCGLAGDDPRRSQLGDALELIAAGQLVIAAAISEPAQHLTRPATVAEHVDGGLRIRGRKIFCTMSPGADALLASVTFTPPGGGDRYGFVTVPADADGVLIHDDWDALGMRTSGSNSVTFEDVRLPKSALVGGFPIGSAAGYARRNLASGPFHAAAALGIAESAHQSVMSTLRGRATDLDGATKNLVAQDEVDLHAARAALARAGQLIDSHHADHPAGRAPDEDVLDVFAEGQAAKAVVTAGAMRVVDRCLVLSGGAGYRAGSPLARAVGDVRALMFMNPLNTTRAEQFLGAWGLGLPAALA